MLEEAMESGRHLGIRRDSNELFVRRAMSDDWRVSAGKHRHADLGSNTQAASSHITFDADGKSFGQAGISVSDDREKLGRRSGLDFNGQCD